MHPHRSVKPLCTRSVVFLVLFVSLSIVNDARLFSSSSLPLSPALFPPVVHGLRLQSPFLNSLTNLTAYNYSRLSDPDQLSFMLGRFSTSIIKHAFATFAAGLSNSGNMVILDPFIHTGLRDEFLCYPLPDTLDLSPEVIELNGARGLEVRNKLTPPDPRYPYLNTSVSIKGAMVFASRGSCPYEVKAYWAQRAGAGGLVVVNSWPPYSESDFQNNDDLITMGLSPAFGDFLKSQNESLSYSHTIPSVFITQYNFASVYRIYLDNIFNQIEFDQRIQRLFPTPCNNDTGNCATYSSSSTGSNVNSSSTGGSSSGIVSSSAVSVSSTGNASSTGGSTGIKKPTATAVRSSTAATTTTGASLTSSKSSTGNQSRSSTAAAAVRSSTGGAITSTGRVASSTVAASSTGVTIQSSTGNSAQSSTGASGRRLLSILSRSLLQSATPPASSVGSLTADQSSIDSTTASTDSSTVSNNTSDSTNSSSTPSTGYLPRFAFVQPYITIEADSSTTTTKQDEQDLSSFRLAAYFLLVLPSLWCLLAMIYVGRRCGSRVREEARRQQRNHLIPTVKFHLVRPAAASATDHKHVDINPTACVLPSPSREHMHDAASETMIPQVYSASLASRHLEPPEAKEQDASIELTSIDLNSSLPLVGDSLSSHPGDAAMSSAAALVLADEEAENEDPTTAITTTASASMSAAVNSRQTSRVGANESASSANSSAPAASAAAAPSPADSAVAVGIDNRGKHHRMTGTTCAICLSDFEEGETLKLLPCTHGFHVSCIDPWLEKSDECAVCRASINSSLPESSRCARWCCPLPSEVSRENQQRREQFQRRMAARNEAMDALRARSGVAEVHQPRSAIASLNANSSREIAEHQIAEAVPLPDDEQVASSAVSRPTTTHHHFVAAQMPTSSHVLPPEQSPLVSSHSPEPEDLFFPVPSSTETSGSGGVKFHLANPADEAALDSTGLEKISSSAAAAAQTQYSQPLYYANEISSSLSSLEQVSEFVGSSVTGRDGSAALLQLRLGVESYSNGEAARTLSPAAAIELIKSFMVSLQILTHRASKRDSMELIEGCVAMESTLTYVQEQIARRNQQKVG